MPAEVYEFRKIGTEEKLPYNTRTYEKTVQVPTIVKQQLWNSSNERLSVAELAAIGLEVIVTPPLTQAEIDFEHYTQIMIANPGLAIRVGEYKAYLDNLPGLIQEKLIVGNVVSGSDIVVVSNFNNNKPIVGSPIAGSGIPDGTTLVAFNDTSITLDKVATEDNVAADVSIFLTNYKANTDQIRVAIEALSLTDTELLELAQNINVAFHDIMVNYQAVAAVYGYSFPSDDFIVWNGMDKLVYYLPSNNPPEPTRTESYVLTE